MGEYVRWKLVVMAVFALLKELPEMAPSPSPWIWTCAYLFPLVFGTHLDIIRERDSIGEADTMENGVNKQDINRSSMTSLSHCINQP